MPTPEKTTNQKVEETARRLINIHGTEFSMAMLAEKVGIKPPSLYKRFRDREEIIRLVEIKTIRLLGAAVTKALQAGDDEPLVSAAYAYREFAWKNPGTYALIYSPWASTLPNAQTAREEALAPLLAYLAGFGAGQTALANARILTAYLHGFVSMESADAFHLGGDTESAFEIGLRGIIDQIKA